jgi:DNA-binding NarL/FixJ family response regulator
MRIEVARHVRVRKANSGFRQQTGKRTQFYRTEFAVRDLVDGSFRVTRILIVDDNPAVRRYLRAILEQQESWHVCGEARTGAEALQQVVDAPPDLIVLDYQMPDLNGVDIAKQIFELFPKIPILMVTLHLSKQLADAAREAGVRGACAKQDIGSVVEAVDVLLHDQTYFPIISSGHGA